MQNMRTRHRNVSGRVCVRWRRATGTMKGVGHVARNMQALWEELRCAPRASGRRTRCLLLSPVHGGTQGARDRRGALRLLRAALSLRPSAAAILFTQLRGQVGACRGIRDTHLQSVRPALHASFHAGLVLFAVLRGGACPCLRPGGPVRRPVGVRGHSP